MQPCLEDNRSFFEKLQNATDLDLRDKRGKRYELAIILVGVTLALLGNRDGCLSSVHRHIKNHYVKLMRHLKLEIKSPISRPQLPRVLEKVSVEVFDGLLFAHYGIKLEENERKWFAGDGKPLRGSIVKGEKRGEAVVQIVEHKTLGIHSQTYYSGRKESEVPTIRKLLEENGLCGQKISLDALHCKPKTLAPIVGAGGIYLVGLKKNQKEMLAEVKQATENSSFLYQTDGWEKGHGRIEYRKSEVYDLKEIYQAERWNNCEIRTVVKVKREQTEVKSNKKGVETSYYLTNQSENYQELCEAVRNHSTVETNNHIRDVTLKEDKMRTKKMVSVGYWQELEVLP